MAEIDNLAEKTGKSYEEWFAILETTGLQKHTELMNVLKSKHGVSHGFANSIVLTYRNRDVSQADDDLVDAQYTGAKAALRPICDALIAAATALGPDVEVVPKKTGVSLRRAKQFAVIEAPSAKRVQLGIQLKGDEPTERLLVGGAMCSHKVNLADLAEVDDELIAWLAAAYDRAG